MGAMLMGEIAEKKKHLIVPADGKPVGWARGWKFPALPWPPGWPRSEALPATLDVNLYPLVTHGRRVMVDVMARDEFRDLTDALDQEFVRIHAHTKGQIVRLRLAEDDEDGVWSKEVLLQIGSKHRFGVMSIFDVDVVNVRSKVTFTVGIYGWDGSDQQVEMEF